MKKLSDKEEAAARMREMQSAMASRGGDDGPEDASGKKVAGGSVAARFLQKGPKAGFVSDGVANVLAEQHKTSATKTVKSVAPVAPRSRALQHLAEEHPQPPPPLADANGSPASPAVPPAPPASSSPSPAVAVAASAAAARRERAAEASEGAPPPSRPPPPEACQLGWPRPRQLRPHDVLLAPSRMGEGD